MNRRTEICRHFQRGNCRFGARCKFLHDTSQQQQPSNPFGFGVRSQPSNPFGFGVKTQPQQGNYYSPLSGLTSPQKQQEVQLQTSIKEHRCSDARVCKQQIKEDLQNEHPVFWRLTCYAHAKYFPNDITGDVSFEELRAHSYDAAKQGMTFENVVQNERAMFSAKNMEFQNLLNNPYIGPASANSGFQKSGIISPPATANASKMLFGTAASNSFSSPFVGLGHNPSSSLESFQSRETFGGGFGKDASGFSLNPANATPSGTQVSTPFSSLSPSSSSFSFGTQSFKTAAPSFGTQSMSLQSPFASTPVPVSNFGQGSSQNSNDLGNFGGDSSSNLFPAVQENTIPSGSFPLQSAPLLKDMMNVEQDASSRDTNIDHGLKGQPKQAVQTDIWEKQFWTLGEIPEDEPPPSAR